MFKSALLSLSLLLPLATPCAGRAHAPQKPAAGAAPPARQDMPAATTRQDDSAAQPNEDEGDTARREKAAAHAQRRESLLADLRALETESKELPRPLDAAAARAEVAAAAWALDREWSKSLLREALPLTFPEEVDRARQRQRPVGAALQFGPAEDRARDRVRRRIFQVAARERNFARELSETVARELGKAEEVQRETALAVSAAREGRIEEASELILRAAEAEPTLINVGEAINQVALRDRAAADRLILGYIERLRAQPLSLFTEHNHAALRLPISFAWLLHPGEHPFDGGAAPPPPSREVVRAYVAFIADTMTRIERAGGDLSRMHVFIPIVWPEMMQHAPEYAAQLAALERAGRRPEQAAPPLRTHAEIKAAYDASQRYEEKVKVARETKDPLNLEVAASAATQRKEFEEARKLIGMMKDGETKSHLAEMVNTKESLALLSAGDLAGAERLARQLNNVSSIIEAYPPLIRRLAKDKDAGRAALLADEAARRLRASAEKNNGNDTFIPTLLAPVAGSIRVSRQTRALEALSELAMAVEPVAPQSALDLLDALVETASKARVTSESGNPNFNAEAFAFLSAADPGRVRSTAARLEDRLQRIAALAAAYGGEAERLSEKGAGEKGGEPR